MVKRSFFSQSLFQQKLFSCCFFFTKYLHVHPSAKYFLLSAPTKTGEAFSRTYFSTICWKKLVIKYLIECKRVIVTNCFCFSRDGEKLRQRKKLFEVNWKSSEPPGLKSLKKVEDLFVFDKLQITICVQDAVQVISCNQKLCRFHCQLSPWPSLKLKLTEPKQNNLEN